LRCDVTQLHKEGASGRAEPYHRHLRSAEKTMSAPQTIQSPVMATTQEVLPKFGLAFLIDDHDTTWTVTRNMEGPGLHTLHTGQRVRLTLNHHADFSMVRAYDPQY
jgi:hypothetical protein